MLDSVSYPALLRWGAYYEIEPWGEWRADARSAQVVATLANINRDPKKRPEPYTIKELLLFPDKGAASSTETAERPSSAPSGAKMDPTLIGWLFRKSGARLKE